MKKIFLFLLFSCMAFVCSAQTLHIKSRKINAVGGKAFVMSICDSTLSLRQREKMILKAIKEGNIPNFMRKLTAIRDSVQINNTYVQIVYYVTPDYLSIGNDSDFLYIPMTPMLAQKVANKTHCSLPTKKMVDRIYKSAVIKLTPQPILPSANMTTVPVFEAHTDSVMKGLQPYIESHAHGALTAGDKKDIVISNKIYQGNGPCVVIYGWHKSDGRPIQPLFNKHLNTWADYSHGVRLVQNKVFINGKPNTLRKVLANPLLCPLLSEEGVIPCSRYPMGYPH
jgi:hypothetical protein